MTRDQEATVAMLEAEARVIFEGCYPDIQGWDLDESAEMIADRLYDEYAHLRPKEGFFPLCKEAIKGYF